MEKARHRKLSGSYTNLFDLQRVYIVLLLCTAGCVGHQQHAKGPALARQDIVYWGTNEYRAKVERLRLTPKEAHSILAKSLQEDGDDTRDRPVLKKIGDHHVILGNDYLFEFKVFDKAPDPGIPLSGYYVDGVDGSIEIRHSQGVITRKEQRKIWGKVMKNDRGKSFYDEDESLD